MNLLAVMVELETIKCMNCGLYFYSIISFSVADNSINHFIVSCWIECAMHFT